MAASIFPQEVPRVSRRWAQRRFSHIVQWREHNNGGHFAALEQPDTVLDDVQTFFGSLRNR